MPEPLLKIQNLAVGFSQEGNERRLIEEVSVIVPDLKIVALVGGSGSGKTTTALSILRLLSPALQITNGQIFWGGEDLLQVSESRIRQIRGGQIGVIFQEPLNAFNPVLTVGFQIEEVLAVHTPLSKKARLTRVEELLRQVEISAPPRIAKSYPHELSGGLRQRAMIAQAIAASPRLLVADEPTSNLDVTIQARIIELFLKLRAELKISMLLITHDLGMVNYLADEMVVLSEGRVVESGAVKETLKNPQTLLTRQLWEAAGI